VIPILFSAISLVGVAEPSGTVLVLAFFLSLDIGCFKQHTFKNGKIKISMELELVKVIFCSILDKKMI